MTDSMSRRVQYGLVSACGAGVSKRSPSPSLPAASFKPVAVTILYIPCSRNRCSSQRLPKTPWLSSLFASATLDVAPGVGHKPFCGTFNIARDRASPESFMRSVISLENPKAKTHRSVACSITSLNGVQLLGSV
ncbi:hypothetical protein J3E72DRAFT_268543 [Bipolaris maydis]|nr:hypothetical protein J3E72DRAFT_268543 [Bipolaris maydis]